MIELIELIIRAIDALAKKAGVAQKPAVDPAWQAQQAEWEQSRREWEARQLAAATAAPPPAARRPTVPPPRPAIPPLPPVPAGMGRAATASGARPSAFARAGSARAQFVLCEVLKPPLSLRDVAD